MDRHPLTKCRTARIRSAQHPLRDFYPWLGGSQITAQMADVPTTDFEPDTLRGIRTDALRARVVIRCGPLVRFAEGVR